MSIYLALTMGVMNCNVHRFLKVNLDNIPVNDQGIRPSICGIIEFIINRELYKLPDNKRSILLSQGFQFFVIQIYQLP